jgi:ABC-type phosphate/phosphonate transport system substrate-binding protein
VPITRHAPHAGTYRSVIVARCDSAVQHIEDLRGATFACTARDSQSGYQGPRRLFAALAGGRPFFRHVVGPLDSPHRVVDTVTSGAADAGALDSYWLELLQAHAPDRARALRVIDASSWLPAPLFVCSAEVDEDLAARLRTALLRAGSDATLAGARDALHLRGIASVDPGRYAALAREAAGADALGYPQLA